MITETSWEYIGASETIPFMAKQYKRIPLTRNKQGQIRMSFEKITQLQIKESESNFCNFDFLSTEGRFGKQFPTSSQAAKARRAASRVEAGLRLICWWHLVVFHGFLHQKGSAGLSEKLGNNESELP